MDNEKEKPKMTFSIVNFNSLVKLPTNKWNKSKGWIQWGDKYPDFILNMYNYDGSSTFTEIIKLKSRLISGKGFEPIKDENLAAFVKSLKLVQETKQATTDYQLFNAIAFEVVWNNGGTSFTSIKQIPMHKLQRGIECAEIPYPHFWYSNNWAEAKKEMYAPEMIPEFDPNKRKGKQIYYYIEYNPQGDGIYPIVEFSQIIPWVMTDAAIRDFHHNEATNNYAPSFILNFATGIPGPEEQEEIAAGFYQKYNGPKGKKIIINWSDGTEQAPTLTPIQLNNSDERYDILKTQIEENIVRGCSVPVQLLISQAGKLAGNEQREELQEEFQNAYISARQEVIEQVLNYLLSFAGFTEELKLATYSDINNIAAKNKQAESQAILRGGKDGLVELRAIISAVNAGQFPLDNARAQLEIMYGFTPEDATRLLAGVGEGIPAEIQAQLIEIKNKL